MGNEDVGFVVCVGRFDTENIFLMGGNGFATKKELPKGTAYCYETKKNGGSGKVVGEFDIAESRRFYPKIHIYTSIEGAKPVFLNIVKNVKRYDSPKDLCEFTMFCEQCDIPYVFEKPCANCKQRRKLCSPPPNYCYVYKLEEFQK